MTVDVEAVKKDFYIDGEDNPPVPVNQVVITGLTEPKHYFDPDEADLLVDKLIAALYDVGYYTDSLGEAQKED